MDSRPVQNHAQAYDEHHNHPHNAGLQQVSHDTEEHQHDHEKKSVLKKVKAKAKKMKDTITKHGHHDNEHGHEYHYDDQHIPDDHDLDEEDDEDEEMIEDPEIHGAPIYDSAAVKSATQAQNLGKPGVNFEGGTSVMGVEPHHQPTAVVVSPTTATDQSRLTDPARTFVGVDEGMGGAHHHKVNLERPMGLEEDPHAPGSRLQAYTPANYETKVTDPTGAGGAEIDTTHLQKSFVRMNVHNEPKPNPDPKILLTVAETHQYPSVGGHRQFEPELSTATKTQFPPAETHDQHLPQFSGEIKTQYPRSRDLSGLSTATTTQYPSAISHGQNLPQMSSATGSQYPSAISHDQNLPQMSSATGTQYPYAGSHDQFVPELSSDPTTLYPPARNHDQNLQEQSRTQYPSAGSHDQFSPEPIPTSTDRYEENPQPLIGQASFDTTTTVEEQPQPHHESMEKPSDQSSYTDKISSATSAMADKAITAKNMVASKLGYGEQDGDRDPNKTRRYHEDTTSGEKPSNESSYTDKISSATSAIADKAVSAKNTVASKLGYGEKGDTNSKVTTHEENKEENASSNRMSGSTTEYGKKIALSLTEKLVPVYGKVAGVGSAVKSKVPGTGAGIDSDKGVSVKDYFAGKLRPGDEDRALSEVISETLHKRNEEETKEVHGEADRDVKRVASDAIHKRGEEPERANDRPLGKVTESEEVKRRLGSGDEETERRREESYVNSPGKGVVDKLKGVFGSWFGKQDEDQSSQGEDGVEHLSGAEVE